MIAEQVVTALAAAVKAMDADTDRHARRVAGSARRLGMRLGVSDADLDTLYFGGIVHDIGKIGVSESILNKAGTLDTHELTRMQAHALIGEAIVAPISSGSTLLPIIRHHHERFDGDGYPDGLRGAEIPLMARIIAICDAFDALVNDRPYRTRVCMSEAMSILRCGAGRQWDPELVELFVEEIEGSTQEFGVA